MYKDGGANPLYGALMKVSCKKQNQTKKKIFRLNFHLILKFLLIYSDVSYQYVGTENLALIQIQVQTHKI